MKNDNMPELRFSGFKDDWKLCKLGEILKINSGRDYHHLNEGKIPVYGTGGYMLSVNDKLSDNDAIGIGRKGTIDKPQLLKAPFWTVDTLFYMTPKGGDLLFCYYLALTIIWKKLDESTGVPSLSKNNIEKIDIKFTSLEEQKKIGCFLNQLDKVIDLLQNEVSNLKQTKKGFLQKMFPKDGETVPELRFPGFTDEWEQRKLGDFTKIVTGSTPLTNRKDYYGGEFLFVSPSDINGNRYIDSTITSLSELGFMQGRKIKSGSSLFVCIGSTIGKVAQTRNDVVTNQQINAVTGNHGTDSNFLFSMLEKQSSKIRVLSTTQAVPIINKSTFSNIDALIPEINEQTRIGDFFRQMDSNIALHQHEIDVLKDLKKGFIAKMFIIVTK